MNFYHKTILIPTVICALFASSLPLSAQVPEFVAQPLGDLNTSTRNSSPRDFAVTDDYLFFTALGTGDELREIWGIGRNSEETVKATNFNFSNGFNLPSISQITRFKSSIIFTASGDQGTEVYRLNLPDWETESIIKDVQPESSFFTPQILANETDDLGFDVAFYFVAETVANGRELWRSDGTEVGTELAVDFIPGQDSGFEFDTEAIFADGKLFVTCNDGVIGNELYVLEGNALLPVADLSPGNGSSDPRDLVSYRNSENEDEVYFTALDQNGQRQLYSTDGTTVGTGNVTNFDLSNGNTNIEQVTVAGDCIIFLAYGNEVWKYDLEVRSLTKVIDLSGEGGITPSPFISDIALGKDGNIYATFETATDGTELWKADPLGNQEKIREGVPGVDRLSPRFLTPFGDAVSFFAYDDSVGFELNHSDGTPEGTEPIGDFTPGLNYQNRTNNFLSVGDIIYYDLDDGEAGREVWSSDGTPEGTKREADINTESASSGPEDFIQFGNGSLFSADVGVFGREIWFTDGTPEGTHLVKDIYPGIEDSSPKSFVKLENLVYFSALAPGSGRELWVTDGTEQGTNMVRDLFPGAGSGIPSTSAEIFGASDGRLYMPYRDESGFNTELAVIDPANQANDDFHELVPGTTASSPEYFGEVGGKVFFTAGTPTYPSANSLWEYDFNSGPSIFLEANNNFSSDGVNDVEYNDDQGVSFSYTDVIAGQGKEFWHSDGTQQNTGNINDLTVGPDGLPEGAEVIHSTFAGTYYKVEVNGVEEVWLFSITGAYQLFKIFEDEDYSVENLITAEQYVLLSMISDIALGRKAVVLDENFEATDIPLLDIADEELPNDLEPGVTPRVNRLVLPTLDEFIFNPALWAVLLMTVEFEETNPPGASSTKGPVLPERVDLIIMFNPELFEGDVERSPGPVLNFAQVGEVEQDVLITIIRDPDIGDEPWLLLFGDQIPAAGGTSWFVE